MFQKTSARQNAFLLKWRKDVKRLEKTDKTNCVSNGF